MQYSAENLLLKSRDMGTRGIFAEVTPAQAGWEYLNMAALRLNRGEKYTGDVGDHEHVSVILGGRCNIMTSAGNFENIGRRADVFSGMPYALYLPRHTHFEIEALTENLEIASCWVPTDQDHPARLVTPPD